MHYTELLQELPLPSIEVEKMRLQNVHMVEDSVEGNQQAALKLEPEQDKEADLAVEAAEEQGQDHVLV